ncbi:hypothetical protein CLHUN_39790 [Ruminiclostridium hungatei]|uniref:Uncharacterized protein n=1 Tax=Ruminiclostridium hungatei TaxID=48256 RepID=A0A1V4SE40_RUMHU|nr:hypothetical protein [Ruminiclostridium hungatei]OPX42192.1 hypothetical protein CLHUN_39790 [Ruminiclostridium hungatei]
MKKIVIISGFILMFLAGFMILYSANYKVDTSNMEKQLLLFQNKYEKTVEKINTIDECNIDNKKFVLLSQDNNLAYAELKRGINDKYKIISVTDGFNSLRYEVIETKKGKYLLLAGSNPDFAIDYITARVNIEEYKIPIQKEPKFITFCRITSWASKSEDPSEVRLFNRNDQEIVVN